MYDVLSSILFMCLLFQAGLSVNNFDLTESLYQGPWCLALYSVHSGVPSFTTKLRVFLW